YHADRFEDRSLLFFDSADRLVAVLPAHRRGTELISHGGLTYGGFVTSARMTLLTMHNCFAALQQHMRESALLKLIYKAVPHIYHRQPAEEDLHALFLAGARVHRRDVLLVIDHEQPYGAQERRRRALRKAEKAGVIVEETADYAPYWDVLAENLRSKYGTTPVHSLDEITLLASRFPEQIRLTVCRDANRVVAGVVAFVTERVAHLQYIGSTSEGRDSGALDAVMQHLIAKFGDRRWFDFGAATEQDGRYVNAGLVEFKEGWGARTVVHDFYTLDVMEQP
ncbi:MAG TPA: GNAT family N-acetyltransferase, partial [Thermoanaerobaculia bacterium]|nr:GNAT family N-acetyltransferase [Thermoanaerobaculia bacterium]